MASYGGYSTTSYGAGGGDDGGGFVYGGSQGGSQTAGKSYNDETLRPVTIKQLIDAEQPYPDADFRIDGAEVKQVTFVGMVRQVSPQTTNITYRLDDGTGLIEAKQWTDPDKDDAARPPFALDQYVRVWGRPKTFNNKRHVGAHALKPVRDFNEVNYHLLEATYVHLYFTKGAPAGEGGGGGGLGGAGTKGDGGLFVDGGYGAGGDADSHAGRLVGVSPRAKKMYNWLHSASGSNEGIHMNLIAQGTGMTLQEVMSAAEELISPGLVYTTIDDETFAILEM